MKKFLIIGNQNAITFKEIFQYIKNNELWLGMSMVKEFVQPDKTVKKFGNVCWFTNIENKRRNTPLDLYKIYTGHENEYPKYDNYDAINVDKVSDIPVDYRDKMGVPITFLDKYNPGQFEIIGLTANSETMDTPVQLGSAFMKDYREQGGTGHFSDNMYSVCYYDQEGNAKVPYTRILIKRKICCKT